MSIAVTHIQQKNMIDFKVQSAEFSSPVCMLHTTQYTSIPIAHTVCMASARVTLTAWPMANISMDFSHSISVRGSRQKFNFFIHSNFISFIFFVSISGDRTQNIQIQSIEEIFLHISTKSSTVPMYPIHNFCLFFFSSSRRLKNGCAVRT